MKKYLRVMHKKLFPTFITWLPIGFAITMMSVLVYASGQFVLRSGANDPQVQIVEDVARSLDAGAPYDVFSSPNPMELRESLAPFVLLYGLDHQPLSGTVQLHGVLPIIPRGVLEYAKKHGEHRLTWQPERGVREAIVVTYHEGLHPAFVVAGRSLHEVEYRESQLCSLVMIAWSLTMLGSLFLSAIIA